MSTDHTHHDDTDQPAQYHDQPDGLTRLVDISLDHPSVADVDPTPDRNPSPSDKSLRGGLKRRAARLGALPAPGQRYTYRAIVADIERSDWQWLVHTQTGATLHDHGAAAEHPAFGGPAEVPGRSRHSTRRVWETPATLAAAILDLRRPDDHPHPCLADGHRGIRCLDADAGVYSCTDDDCERVFSRAVAEAIVEADTA